MYFSYGFFFRFFSCLSFNSFFFYFIIFVLEDLLFDGANHSVNEHNDSQNSRNPQGENHSLSPGEVEGDLLPKVVPDTEQGEEFHLGGDPSEIGRHNN